MGRKPLEECQHEFLRFGSNCYYLFCADCDASWVFKHYGVDKGDPDRHARCPVIEHNVRISPAEGKRLAQQHRAAPE